MLSERLQSGRNLLRNIQITDDEVDHVGEVVQAAETAALRVAMAKWGAVRLTGSQQYRERQARRCVALGIAVVDPDLAAIVVDERQRCATGASRPPEARRPAGPRIPARPAGRQNRDRDWIQTDSRSESTWSALSATRWGR